MTAIEAGAPSFGVQVFRSAVRNAVDLERAMSEFAAGSNGGLIVQPGSVIAIHRELIVALAARHRLPAVHAYRYFVTIGGLASYGVDNIDLYRQASSYVHRILKGERPSDLPVQRQPPSIWCSTSRPPRHSGCKCRRSLLARADEVIE